MIMLGVVASPDRLSDVAWTGTRTISRPAGRRGAAVPAVSEGHVNRIKMLKRQMFGRAKPDLLRKRILLTA
ncbi:hypothetical protein [Streptomyces mirabilis]|uniref:hypothetical protein n=1 Tax=Streptomyces mirabilis TaxID=68239 RepID=UPI0033B5D3F1